MGFFSICVCSDCCRPNFEVNVKQIIQNLEIDDNKKQILRKRYVNEVIKYNSLYNRYAFWYNSIRFLVTVGSMIVSALLPVQHMGSQAGFENEKEFANQVYWFTWLLSLCVSIFNAIMQLFSLDQKYLMAHFTCEELVSEGWHYFTLSGKYIEGTHETEFSNFSDAIEDIKLKQLIKEHEIDTSTSGKKNHTNPLKKNKNNLTISN